jgi:putative colanic acid biosynthesis UDP-glucose lipid carrier transferase
MPVLITIGILIKIESQGPALFRQRRYGINGAAFNCLKFRTMTVLENGNNVDQATRNDPRVTSLGRILRRWSVDELPQLINVWRGEMSMVGPRPHAEAHNEFYRNKVRGYMRRHSLKPGITGWAQVLGLRGATETIAAMDTRVKADLHYINNWNLILDLEILLLTLIRFRSPNAY